MSQPVIKHQPIPKHVDRLYKAVAAYVKASGGNVAVIGGIQVQQFPGERAYNFTIGIKCTGRRPQFESTDVTK